MMASASSPPSSPSDRLQPIILDPDPRTSGGINKGSYTYESLPTNINKENTINSQSLDDGNQTLRRFGQNVNTNTTNNTINTQATPSHGPLSTRHATGDGQHRGWVEGMVKVATACNQLVQKNYCNMCHVYTNRQVEFEQQSEQQHHHHRQQQQQQSSPQSEMYEYFVGGESTTHAGIARGGSPTARVWQTMNTGLEVDIYRQFLFDEASVGGHDDDGMNLLDSAMESAAAAVAGVTATATATTTTTTNQPSPAQQDETAATAPEGPTNDDGLEEC